MENLQITLCVTPQQKEACYAIRSEVFVGEQNVPIEIEKDEYDSVAYHFLALHEGDPVGTARVVLKENGSVAKIGRVAVLNKARGQGIGAKIMKAIEAAPEVQNVEFFVLEAQSYVIPFYEQLGYSAEGKEYREAGIPHRWMQKKNIGQAASHENKGC